MSTLKVNTIQNSAGVEVYTAKAWVNFNGTGTVAIRAAGNVSSITDNGVGDYTVNFTTAMSDINYAATTLLPYSAFAITSPEYSSSSRTTSAFRFRSLRSDGSPGLVDTDNLSVTIFR